MMENKDKLKMHTANLADDNYSALVKMFPNAVTETINENGEVIRAVDAEVLAQEINTQVISDKEERYQFTWPDKRKSVLLANEPIAATLRPCREESVDFDSTENLYIEGDNLDVLKLLRETYLNKIKMIYIDPPYNTGNDFIYEDDFSESTEEFLQRDGQYDEQGHRLTSNLQSNGRFHTDWLNMMYPRIKIARELLTKDGALFISIDDNESANLNKICEEIFGKDNVENEVWNKEAEGSSGTLKQISTIRRIHENIIICFKNKQLVQFNKIREALKGKENELQTANLAVNSDKENPNHPNYFTITNSYGEQFTKQWKWNEKEINKLISENLIYWGSDGHKQPRLVIPTDDRRRTFLRSILNYGGTTVGRKDFENLMGKDIEFSYPKPVILIKKLLETATTKSTIVLDFFSGSATTAHAVMQLNAEDGGRRKHIMVQLPELTDEKSEAHKAGYENICEIGKERIRRAGKKIKEEAGLTAQNLDTGFRVLKLDSSNMKDVYYTPEEYAQLGFDMKGFMDNIKPDRSGEDLLFQIMLDLGIPLSAKIEQDDEIYYVNDNYLIACFDRVDTSLITKIAQKKPFYAVFRDSSFANDSVLVNVEQIFNTYSPETERRVL